ncbi:hypothetical protein GCM10010246_21080 [Streptomyces cuspidosporus]|uniref:Transposase n=1 Tax=Streptomyces cuspidosporus TaxID=66882 RepID=A0ABN3FSD3_9ACTN
MDRGKPGFKMHVLSDASADMAARQADRSADPGYERDPSNCLAFLGLAAAMCCYKRLSRLTTWDTV